MPIASTPSTPAVRTTRCWTLTAAEGSVDVEVVAGDDAPLADVVPGIAREMRVAPERLWSTSAPLPEDLPLAAPELAHGAVLGWGRPAVEAASVRRSSALELHVTGGPEAGRALPLGGGRHVLGRSSEASIRLDDPDVSRCHVQVEVGAGGITVADLRSTNGSRLDGSELAAGPRSWHVGSTLRLGASALTVRGPAEGPTAVDRCAGGRLAVRPIPRAVQPRESVEITFPRAPEPRTPRRLALIAVALPAVGGVLMAVVLHTPTFLFFALLSPLVALATWISERWSGRRTGRRERAEHAAATRIAAGRLEAAVANAVRVSEEDVPDLAALTTAARRRSRLLWSRPRDAADALTIRVGTGPGATTVVRIDGDGRRRSARSEHLPVPVDLREGGLSVVGPRARAMGVLSAAVVQLTALSAPGEIDLLLLLDAARVGDWAWTRWLPHLAPRAVAVRDGAHQAGATTEDDEALAARLNALIRQRSAAMAGEGMADGPPGWLVVVVDRPLDARLTALLADARTSRVLVLQSAETPEALPVVLGTVLRLGGETGDVAVLSTRHAPDRHDITTDRITPAVAGQFARDLAALAPASTSGALPAEVRLRELPTQGLRFGPDGKLDGVWATDRSRLLATIGRTADGNVEVDLCRDGPHALIAGTTGSGKSELLQSLITGLALTHPPDRCSFLLVDYKGGAAFADAAALPHTVGVVTDLDGQTTVRALRSLAAELTRRESILGTHHVTDIAALPADVSLARLVIVVDEFATLAEELPSFVPGLVSIAQRGRSLGVHLVLATQRPSGVVSPEIRANCTLRICLRTTDESDSRDVLGTPAAAFLPVALPGRAYLRAGHATPSLLQVARVAVDGTPGATPAPAVRRWSWPAAGSILPPVRRGRPQDTDLAQVTRALADHAIATRVPAPHRPWRAPLPDRLEWSALPGTDAVAGRGAVVRIGLVDLPDRQAQTSLELDVSEGGTWLVVGGVRSGRSTVLRTILGEATRALDPDSLHVYVLDPGGGSLASEARRLPHTGTAVGGADALRTVRLVDRLGQEVAARRAAPEVARPNVLLLVDGVEAISALLDDADPGRGADQLHRLMRDGAAAGFTCVVTADRAVPGGRLAAVATHRLVLPLADRADYAVAGVPPRCVPEHRPPGRGLLDEDAAECQVALPRPLPETAERFPRDGSARPVRIVELPADPDIPRTVAEHSGVPGAQSSVVLAVGPGGDEGEVLSVELARTGGLLVVGPPGSGRTAALDAFAERLRWGGVPVLRVGRGSAEADASSQDDAEHWLHPSDVHGLEGWIAGLDGRPGVLVVDDLGPPAEEPSISRLGAIEAAASVALLAATGPGCLSSHYQGPVAALRRSRSGLLLSPGPGDADLMGVRLPRTPVPVRPGSGWLITGGAAERIQVARCRPRPGRDGAGRPQSSSSRGPISWVANQASS